MDEALSDVVHEGHVGLSVKPGLEGRADFVGLLRAVCEQVDDREGQGLRDAGEGGLAVAKLVVGAVENAVDAADPGVDDGMRSETSPMSVEPELCSPSVTFSLPKSSTALSRRTSRKASSGASGR